MNGIVNRKKVNQGFSPKLLILVIKISNKVLDSLEMNYEEVDKSLKSEFLLIEINLIYIKSDCKICFKNYWTEIYKFFII